uniref:Selenoprotein P N-terminal domain-containing protein n=3 Tax=Magallana gigas TaxID=29159 RepID=A0A8W8KDB8_MAGGI
MCQQQAEGLEKLMTSYQNIGKRDISFFIVNHARGEASVNELTRRVSFPVYQDDNTSMIQQTLNASIDDLFLYDRCGTLVYHLRKPESLVSHGTMQSNLLTTYLNNPCKCTDKFKSKVSTKPTLYQLQRQAGSSPSSIIRRRRHVLNHFGTPLVSTNNVPSPNDRPSD